MAEIQIIKATFSDIDQIREISIQTFTETFGSVNTKQNIDDYVTTNLDLKVLALEIKSRQSSFYFAKSGEQILGYLKVNWGKAQTENIDEKALEIQRIYVLQEYHGKQIGQLLLSKAILIAKNKTLKFIWLGVWENNEKALRFYKKSGFVTFDKHLFTMGLEVQTDLLLRLQTDN